MGQSRFILGVLGLVVLAAGGACGERPPNVLFILADDLGYADVTLYGHTRFYRTPHLERLAERGMTFTRAYAASPLCSPTRSSILTGLSPARTGMTSPNCHLPQVVLEAMAGEKGPPGKKAVGPAGVTRLDPKFETLAERLKEAGYATGHFGKWHLGTAPYSALEHGFDVDVPHWHGPGPAGSYVAPWKFPDFDPRTPREHIEDRMAQEAVAFMEEHQGGPFFLNYWMFSVHAPFDAKRELITKYRERVDPEDPQRSPTYAAMVESMDDAVGALLDALDRLGITEETIVVFFSDNGGNMYNEIDGTTPTSNAPLRGGKATMFEGGVRVPMVVSWPGVVVPGSRSEVLVQSTDFFPTILEMLGMEAKSGREIDGVSVVPALKGERFDRGAIHTYFPHDPPVPDWMPPAVSVHRDHWKLIRQFHQGDDGAHRHLLYDLKSDPGERNNLAAGRPELVRKLDAEIEEFLAATKAVRPVRNPAFEVSKYRPELEGVPRNRKKSPSKEAKPDGSSAPALKGWKARGCRVVVENGIVTVSGTSAEPFLGVGAGVSGPATVTVRMRSAAGGQGKVEWIPDRETAGRAVRFSVAGGWQERTVKVPAEGPLGIVRLYLPAASQMVEVDWIELRGADGTRRRWDF